MTGAHNNTAGLLGGSSGDGVKGWIVDVTNPRKGTRRRLRVFKPCKSNEEILILDYEA